MGNRVLGAAERLLAAALAILLSCFSAPAVAAPKVQAGAEPMQFAIVRGSGALCQPDCPEWIWAEGTITADTASRFKKFLKRLGKRNLPLVIQSPGGDIDSAFAMGRLIRARGMDVAVGYTNFTSCAPRDTKCKAEKEGGYTGTAASGFAYCNSACPLVLAGGVRRVVGSWAHLGVHQITTVMTKQRITYRTTTRIVKGKKVVKKEIVSRKNTGTYSTTEMSKSLRRKVEGYLEEMGVSKGLIDPMEATPAAEILRLPQDKLLALNLITSLDQVELLTGQGVCRASPRPENCAAAPAGVFAGTVIPTPTFRDAALAADGMRFRIVRGGGLECHPDCPEWIWAEGRIVAGSADGLRKTLSAMGTRRLPVLINSAEGDVDGAMRLGRLVRENGLDVAVARTELVRCGFQEKGCPPAPDDRIAMAFATGGDCIGACVLVLASGKRRIVQQYANVALSYLEPASEVERYLDEIGADNRLILQIRMLRGSSGSWTVLRNDLLAGGLVTDLGSATEFTAPGVCKLSSRPGNCRVADDLPRGASSGG